MESLADELEQTTAAAWWDQRPAACEQKVNASFWRRLTTFVNLVQKASLPLSTDKEPAAFS